jgi:hypothetical protein
MKRTAMSCALAILIGSSVALAQNSGTQGGSSDRPAGQSEGSGARGTTQTGTMTLVGCVKAGDAVGTSGSAAANSSASSTRDNSGMYLLTNARTSASRSSSSGGPIPSGVPANSSGGAGQAGAGASSSSGGRTAGTTGTTGRDGTTYVLDGGTDLAQHVGHQVEVTGMTTRGGRDSSAGGSRTGGVPGATTQGGDPGRDSTAADAARGGNTGTSSANSGTARLRVSTVRMISATCSE